MDATFRLQIANRIHLFLLRELGQGIDVKHMLDRPLYARDVLLVCDACQGSPLQGLAQRFREATRAAKAAKNGMPRPGRAPQAAPWASDTSGFGVTQPPAASPSEPAPERHDAPKSAWFSPARWLGS